MATPSWLHQLARQWFPARRVRRREARSSVCLQVEQLESRLTPSGNSFQITANPAPILGYEFQGTVGQAFSETLSGPSSGTNSYAVAQGQLPPGITSGNLSSTGLISGTPSTPGQYNVAFQVTNTISGTETTVFQFLISPQAAATITSGSNNVTLPAGTINVNSTAGFPSNGSIEIQTGAGVTTTVQYNGLSPNGTAFLNCTGGTGTLLTGDLISPTTAPAATIASTSGGVSLSSNPGVINVSSTAGFPSTNGAIEIQTDAGVTTLVQYANLGKNGTTGSPQFQGVTGGTGTLQTGDFVITAPAFSVSTSMQPLNALNALQYNNQTLPLGIVDQPYNATVTATNPSDTITNVQITTYNKATKNLSPAGSTNATIAGIYVKSAGNTYTITGLDANGPALKVSWTSGNVLISGTPTFSTAGFSYPLFLSVKFQDGTTHNFNFSFGNSPQEIESAYGFNNVGNGAGQTIVILEGGGVPNLVSSTDPNFANSDLNQFDQIFPGLNTFNQPGGPVFLTMNSTGSIYNGSGGDETEIIQDIEWAHALAPMANIVDMEGSTSTFLSDITGTTGNVNFNSQFLQALQNRGLVSTSSLFVVGTSFGRDFGPGGVTVNPLSNVTFIGSSGDNGPTATSGNVVLTGYTQLTQSPTSSYVSEAAVNGVPDNFRSGGTLYSGGSGGSPGSSYPSP